MILDKILEELSPILTENISLIRFEDCLTNTLYQLKTDKGRFALRVNSPYAARLGINRDRELAILEFIQTQVWCIPVICKTSNYLLTSWIDSRPIEPTKQLKQISTLIKSVHNLNTLSLKVPVLNINDQLEYLLNQTTKIDSSFLTCLDAYRKTYQFPSNLTLCHHDWHSGNLLQSETQLFLNDWEYAALGDPLVDIVCAIDGFNFEGPAKEILRNQLGVSIEQLAPIEPLVKAMSILWYQVRFPEQNHQALFQTFVQHW